MGGIPSGLYKDLCDTLLACGPFFDVRELRAVFGHPKLRPFQSRVPTAADAAALVRAVIDVFWEKQRADTGEYVLVILLRVLSEQVDPVEVCHQQLAKLADDLEQALGGRVAAIAYRLPEPTVAVIITAVEEDQLEAALELLKSTPLKAQAALLSQRLSHIKTQTRQGLLTQEQANVERSKIAAAILALLKP